MSDVISIICRCNTDKSFRLNYYTQPDHSTSICDVLCEINTLAKTSVLELDGKLRGAGTDVHPLNFCRLMSIETVIFDLECTRNFLSAGLCPDVFLRFPSWIWPRSPRGGVEGD